MEQLISNFFGYLQFYTSRIIPILILGVLFECIFLFLTDKGYIVYKQKSYNKRIIGMFLSLSIALVIVMTLYGRQLRMENECRFQLFASYIETFREGNVELLLQIIMNIFMFVPIGFLLPCCFKRFEKNKRVLFLAILFSGIIECIQGIFKIGMFEVDDILGNAFGAELGFLLYYFLHKTYQKFMTFHE